MAGTRPLSSNDAAERSASTFPSIFVRLGVHHFRRAARRPRVGEPGAPLAAFPPPAQPGLRRVTVGLWKPSFSPDATRLAVGRTKGGIEIVELATGVRTKLCHFGKDPAWSPDGRFIAFASEGKEEIW